MKKRKIFISRICIKNSHHKTSLNKLISYNKLLILWKWEASNHDLKYLLPTDTKVINNQTFFFHLFVNILMGLIFTQTQQNCKIKINTKWSIICFILFSFIYLFICRSVFRYLRWRLSEYWSNLLFFTEKFFAAHFTQKKAHKLTKSFLFINKLNQFFSIILIFCQKSSKFRCIFFNFFTIHSTVSCCWQR